VSEVAFSNLGLVCITHSPAVRYRTITRTRLLTFSEPEQRQLLHSLYADNIARLHKAVAFCYDEQIQLYRLPSNLFPFADSSLGSAILGTFAPELATIGDRVRADGLRLVIHPDPFVVLNSDRPEVLGNSLKVLLTHARVLDLLKQPQSPWTVMEVHGGKANRAERLVEVIQTLPPSIRNRLALENDEYSYGATEILQICRAAGVSMVFDAHHHVIHEGLLNYEYPSVAEMLAAARSTWSIPDWQLVHISNGNQSFADRRHSDIIATMPSAYRNVPWIEVEAKQKEVAIAKLRTEWLGN
jgi:UV DNA damage endonuclease